MELASLPFAYFFLVTLTGAWLLGRHPTARKLLLLGASYLFASRLHVLFLATLVGSTLAHHLLAGALRGTTGARARRALLAAGLAFDVALLGWFKYLDFFLDAAASFADWLGLPAHPALFRLAAPLGLSFYTFQGIAYLVDTYRGQAVRPASLLDFALFQAFFPRFAAGPIVRSHELLPQLQAAAPERIPDASRAVILILAGLAKKLVLGTYLATHMTEDAFQAPGSATALELWIALFAYSAQIYLDFSGYTDLARGCALLLGFDLPENFRYPYAARDLGDYWRRWHLTFSGWLRAYVYVPLGGSRRGRARTYLNLILTFLVCGLWHGPTWGFVIWGGLHGVMLAAHRAARDLRRARGRSPTSGWPAVVSWAATFLFVSLVRVFFKAEHLDRAWAYVAGLAGAGPATAGIGLEWGVAAVTALTIALNLAGRSLFDGVLAWHDRLPGPARPLVWIAGGLALFTLRPYDVPFTIYFAF